MIPRRKSLVVVFPALLLLLVVPGSLLAASAGRCTVDARTSLEQCLRDAHVHLVVISQDHAVGSDFAKYLDKPLAINRCGCAAVCAERSAFETGGAGRAPTGHQR